MVIRIMLNPKSVDMEGVTTLAQAQAENEQLKQGVEERNGQAIAAWEARTGLKYDPEWREHVLRPDGPFRESTGSYIREGTIRNGEWNGEVREYKDGVLRKISNYKNGWESLARKLYREDGTLALDRSINEDGNIVDVHYGEDGKTEDYRLVLDRHRKVLFDSRQQAEEKQEAPAEPAAQPEPEQKPSAKTKAFERVREPLGSQGGYMEGTKENGHWVGEVRFFITGKDKLPAMIEHYDRSGRLEIRETMHSTDRSKVYLRTDFYADGSSIQTMYAPSGEALLKTSIDANGHEEIIYSRAQERLRRRIEEAKDNKYFPKESIDWELLMSDKDGMQLADDLLFYVEDRERQDDMMRFLGKDKKEHENARKRAQAKLREAKKKALALQEELRKRRGQPEQAADSWEGKTIEAIVQDIRAIRETPRADHTSPLLKLGATQQKDGTVLHVKPESGGRDARVYRTNKNGEKVGEEKAFRRIWNDAVTGKPEFDDFLTLHESTRYDDNGNPVESLSYDPDGRIHGRERFRSWRDENGEWHTKSVDSFVIDEDGVYITREGVPTELLPLDVLDESSGQGGNVALSVNADGKRYFRDADEVLEDFIKELDGVELNEEQRGIYDVVTKKKRETDIRKRDLKSIIKFRKGSRGKGRGKIINTHYAGLRNPVTAREVIDMGIVIRYGTLVKDGTDAHPTSYHYEYISPVDGAKLTLVVDRGKKGDEEVINYYSNRKVRNRGQEASSGSMTSSSENTIANPGADVKPGNTALSVGGFGLNANARAEMEKVREQSGNTALSVGERPGRAPEVRPGGDVREAGEGALAWLRRKFVHSQTPVFDAVRRVMGVGREPPDALNVEAAAKNVHGKIRARQEMLQRAYLEPLKAILAQPGLDRKRFDDYALALHALERNRMIQERSVVVDPTTGEVVDLGLEAGSGVTNAWAERVIREIQRDPFAAQYKEAANILAEMNRFVLRGAVADGLLTEAQARTWMRLSPHYVPLKSGGAAPGAIHKRATGRFTRPDSVLVNSMRQAYATVRNGELNRVNKTMADWIREYDPNGEQVGGTVPESHKHAKIKMADPQYVPKGSTAEALLRERGIRLVETEDKGGYWVDTGVLPNALKRVVRESVPQGDDIVTFWENGERKFIRFEGKRGRDGRAENEAARIADALNFKNVLHKEGKFWDAIRGLTRWKANVSTSWNPTFIVRNMGADVFNTANLMMIEGKYAELARTMRNYPAALRTIARLHSLRREAGDSKMGMSLSRCFWVIFYWRLCADCAPLTYLLFLLFAIIALSSRRNWRT